MDNFESLEHNYDYLLVNTKNIDKLSDEFLDKYNFKRTISHRKWFPENIYRNKGINDIIDLVKLNENRVLIQKFYLHRNFKSNLGSTNFVLLKSKEFESIE